MKRLHYSAITAALVLLPFLANAKGEEYDIPIRKVIINTRSIIGLPEASIDAQSGQLSVSFDSGGTCALLVEDSLGVPVYTSTLPADGMEYSYDLSRGDVPPGYCMLVFLILLPLFSK